MSESGSSALGRNDEEVDDDPGRDPKGLNPTRNPMSGGFSNPSGGPDQDSGRGEPEASPGIEGQTMMPESPTDDDDRV